MKFTTSELRRIHNICLIPEFGGRFAYRWYHKLEESPAVKIPESEVKIFLAEFSRQYEQANFPEK
jgi:hypothetical protein